MKKPLFLAALALVCPPLFAEGPAGFAPTAPAATSAPHGPQGFGNTAGITTVDRVKANARDDDIVTLRGRFTSNLRKDKYVFTDEKGASIQAELDHDKDWSQVRKDAPVEIVAEVDKDLFSIELDVISAKPLQ